MATAMIAALAHPAFAVVAAVAVVLFAVWLLRRFMKLTVVRHSRRRTVDRVLCRVNSG